MTPPPDQASPEAGASRRFGRYRLVEPLGTGAFATVWRGVDDELDIEVAVKVLADNWSLNSQVRARFLEEARLLRRIASDRTVRVHDVGEAEGRPYFVMDLVAGGTMGDVGADVPVADRLRLTAERARAVHVLHGVGVAHRDVKPSNLLVDRTTDPPRVLVADLGTAKQLSQASGFTMTAGTPAYMAPEQARGAGVDARCDVYSIAVVTYELVSGRLPFNDPLDRPESPTPIAADAGLPRSFDRLLGDALAIDPCRRPADAATFADLLDQVADGVDIRRRLAPREFSPAMVWFLAAVCFLTAFAAVWFGLK